MSSQAVACIAAVELARRCRLRALGVEIAERLEVLVERGAHGAVGVVVAPFAAGGGVDLGAAPHQLAAEFLELRDARRERVELRGVLRPHDAAPLLHHLADAVVELEQGAAYFLAVGISGDM